MIGVKLSKRQIILTYMRRGFLANCQPLLCDYDYDYD